MVDRSKAHATNPTLPLARQVAEARLKRSGFMTLKSLKRPDAATAAAEHRFPQKLVEKLAGG